MLRNNISAETESDQTVIEHISDLRKVILKSAVFFVAAFGIIIFSLPKIVPYLTNGYEIVLLGPFDVIRYYAGVSGVLALGLSFPVLAYQLWKFFRPALTPTESKTALTYIPFIFISFAAGVAFSYFTVFPVVFQFLMGLGEMSFHMMVTARQYFSFMITLTLALGLLFELPITMMFLTSLGMISPQKLKKLRKPSYLILTVISALMTPPDFVSQLIVLIPLVALYELGIILSNASYKKKMKTELQVT